MNKCFWLTGAAVFLSGLGVAATAMAAGPDKTTASGPTVLELFTSQGCSSCPPADSLAARLAADPSLVVLSFHVNYWDNLGWKDPYSSQASTDRQYAYGKAFGTGSVFTPQLIVGGTDSMVGSEEGRVESAVATARKMPPPVSASLTKNPDGSFGLSLSGRADGAEIWEARFVRHATTRVGGGENGGRSLDTVDNVTSFKKIGAFAAGTSSLPALQGPDDGIAVIVQQPGPGKILGAAIAN